MRILVTGQVEYRSPNAAALRVNAVVEVISELGHQVDVFEGLDSVPAAEPPASNARYHPAAEPDALASRLLNKIGVGYRLLNSPLAREHFDVIYCYGSELSWLVASWTLAKRMGAKLIVDVTEFYDGYGMLASFSSFRARLGSWIGILIAIPLLADSVAAPSRRFQRLFRRLNKKAHLLPPFFPDIRHGAAYQPDADCLRLVYAGRPSNKELLPLLFRALKGLDIPEGKRVSLRLVGVDQNEAEQIAGRAEMAELQSRRGLRIEPLGRQPLAVARDEVSQADFAIAIRAPSWRVNFGFPSKVAESLSLGTPVICNDYSDLLDYVEDQRNSVVLKRLEPDALGLLLRECMAMAGVERAKMRSEAAVSGKIYFGRVSGSAVVENLFGRAGR